MSRRTDNRETLRPRRHDGRRDGTDGGLITAPGNDRIRIQMPASLLTDISDMLNIGFMVDETEERFAVDEIGQGQWLQDLEPLGVFRCAPVSCSRKISW